MSKKGGFTIIELLIVIVVIGVLATLALNTVGNARRNAENAKIISNANAYIEGILAYVIDNGTYPTIADSTSHCLGTDYTDTDSDTVGDCYSYGGYVYTQENAALNAELAPYMGSSTPNVSNYDVKSNSYPYVFRGAWFLRQDSATLNGSPQAYWLEFNLDGEGQDCGASPLAESVGSNQWEDVDPGETNSWTGDGYTYCSVYLRQG